MPKRSTASRPTGGPHQFLPGVDPYVVKGDAKSGLLPFFDADGPGKEGDGDRRVQAYCFRMCLTDHPENRIPFTKPEGYNELWYELLLRNFEAGERGDAVDQLADAQPQDRHEQPHAEFRPTSSARITIIPRPLTRSGPGSSPATASTSKA